DTGVQVGLPAGRRDCRLAAALPGTAIGAAMPAGRIIGGKFVDRQASTKPRGKSICRVVVLMGAFECRDPYRRGAAGGNRPLDFRRGVIEMMTQPARRPVVKADRLQPDQRGASLRLV